MISQIKSQGTGKKPGVCERGHKSFNKRGATFGKCAVTVKKKRESGQSGYQIPGVSGWDQGDGGVKKGRKNGFRGGAGVGCLFGKGLGKSKT